MSPVWCIPPLVLLLLQLLLLPQDVAAGDGDGGVRGHRMRGSQANYRQGRTENIGVLRICRRRAQQIHEYLGEFLILEYMVFHQLADLGGVELDLRCSTHRENKVLEAASRALASFGD